MMMLIFYFIFYIKHANPNIVWIYYIIGSYTLNLIAFFITLDIYTFDINTLEHVNKDFLFYYNDINQENYETQTREIVADSHLNSPQNNNFNKENIKSNFLKKIHKELLSSDRSHLPIEYKAKTSVLISKDAPSYGKNLVYTKPSLLLEHRDLPSMTIEKPNAGISGDLDKILKLKRFLKGVDVSVQLYTEQQVKFTNTVSCIEKGTEPFYPDEAKPLLDSYIKAIPALLQEQQKVANKIIEEIHKIDPSFVRNSYIIDNENKK